MLFGGFWRSNAHSLQATTMTVVSGLWTYKPLASSVSHTCTLCCETGTFAASQVGLQQVASTMAILAICGSMRADTTRLSTAHSPQALRIQSFCATYPDRPRIVARCSTEASSSAKHDVAATDAGSKAAEPDPRPSKFKLWLLCIKPPMYAVGIAPMVLAAALAYLLTGIFPATCGDFTLGGILVIAWLNLRCVHSFTCLFTLLRETAPAHENNPTDCVPPPTTECRMQ